MIDLKETIRVLLVETGLVKEDDPDLGPLASYFNGAINMAIRLQKKETP